MHHEGRAACKQHGQQVASAGLVEEADAGAGQPYRQGDQPGRMQRGAALNGVQALGDVIGAHRGVQLTGEALDLLDAIGVDSRSRDHAGLGAEDRPAMDGGDDIGKGDLRLQPVQPQRAGDALHRLLDAQRTGAGAQHEVTDSQDEVGAANQVPGLQLELCVGAVVSHSPRV